MKRYQRCIHLSGTSILIVWRIRLRWWLSTISTWSRSWTVCTHSDNSGKSMSLSFRTMPSQLSCWQSRRRSSLRGSCNGKRSSRTSLTTRRTFTGRYAIRQWAWTVHVRYWSQWPRRVCSWTWWRRAYSSSCRRSERNFLAIVSSLTPSCCPFSRESTTAGSSSPKSSLHCTII